MYIIAEIGVNHCGDLDLAYKLIDAAVSAGADCVKFQAFTASSLATEHTPKVKYQIETSLEGESHYEMLRKLELGKSDFEAVLDHCIRRGVELLVTPYDVESAEMLVELGCNTFKTASADIIDYPLHEFLSKNSKKVIISTGMSTLGEIENVLLYYQNSDVEICLLHCTSNYPCSAASVNLEVISTLRTCFQLEVGYSDHTVGAEAAILSVAYGATILEKHFTLDRDMAGPDHKASTTPDEFAEIVRSIQRAEEMIGSPVKRLQDEELEMRNVSRKSIVLAKNVVKGDRIGPGTLACKRPGTGLSPEFIKRIVGRKATRNLSADHQVELGDFD